MKDHLLHAFPAATDGSTDLYQAVFGSSGRTQLAGSIGANVRATRVVTPVIPEEAVFRDVINALPQVALPVNSEAAVRKLLAKHLTSEQMANVKIVSAGKHSADDGILVVCGSAQFDVRGEAIVLAVGNGQSTARGASRIYINGNVTLSAYDQVLVYSTGNCRVHSYGRVRGRAFGQVEGDAHGQSIWIVGENAVFDGVDGAALYGEGDANLRAYGNSRVRARGKTQAKLFGKSTGWFEEQCAVEVNEGCSCYYKDPVTIRRKSQEAQVFHMTAGPLLKFGDWPKF